MNKSYFESHPLLYVSLNTFLTIQSNADQKQKLNMKHNILTSQSQNWELGIYEKSLPIFEINLSSMLIRK